MDRICIAPGCGFSGKTTWKRGLCGRCYGRAYHKGTLDKVALPTVGPITLAGDESPFWKDGAITYSAMHKRLTRTLGRASSFLCADGCGAQAAHWSYDGYCPREQFGNAARNAKPYCPDLRHYQPRCESCHRNWDRDQDYVADAANATF